ncbi:hypothetical protein BJY52DRAFT_1284443 [Lactarius psammicola]|nr:hypothetical protein BJY52DRAFT_1284443 [Lactarius psammicola]
MSNSTLPDMPYLTEPERAQFHPAVVRTLSIPSIPPNFPFNTPISDERRHRGPRYIIGWLEFQSPEQPDPEVARPGDVWIQLPSGHRKARVYACYSPQGKDWSPWAGNNVPLGARGAGNTPMHPFLNDQAQRKFFLVFNGTQFTWANPKGVSIILHTNPQMLTVGPAEAVIKWLKVTGVGQTSPATIEEDVHSTSAPVNGRKHAHPDQNGSPGDSASAPPEKKPKRSPSQRPPERPLAVKLGAYAQAGATQQGWIMYIDGMPLHMPFPCINCTRTKTPCSGIPGERCGRCRFKRLGCSHHTQKPHDRTASPGKEVPKASATAEPSPTTQTGLTFRLPPLRPWVPVNPVEAARPEDANKAPGQSSPRRVRIRSSSVGTSNLFPSPLFSKKKKTHFTTTKASVAVARSPPSTTTLIPTMALSAVSQTVPDLDPEGEGEGEGEPRSSVTAAEVSPTDKTLLQDEAAGGEDDEDEEFARFVQMTLDGMARAQEGLRGVFALTRRRLAVKRTTAAATAAPQVAGVGEGTAAVAAAAVASADACAPGGDHGPVSAPH